jgi:hypothetical protein
MRCYECSLKGQISEAIGICHHCSIALCFEHATLVADPIHTTMLINRDVVLPKKARALLCRTCLDALRQLHLMEKSNPGSL